AERVEGTRSPRVGAGERLPSATTPAWGRANRAAARAQVWVQLTLAFVVAALLVYLASHPRLRSSRALISQEREVVDLRLTLEELRAVIADYRADHAAFPGRSP